MRKFIGNRAYTITITYGEQTAKCRHWQTSKAASIAASQIAVESVRKKVPFATRWRIADNFGNKAECEVT